MKLVYNELSSLEFHVINQQILTRLGDIVLYYPHFDMWLKKVERDLINNKRKVITLSSNNELVGISIIKSNMISSKLCTLWVHPDFRRYNIGTFLILKSCYFTQNNTIITIPNFRHHLFKKILEKFNVKLIDQIKHKYVQGEIEYIYKIPQRSFYGNNINMWYSWSRQNNVMSMVENKTQFIIL